MIATDQSGNQRAINVGDILYLNEAIKADDGSTVVIETNDGKEITVLPKNTLVLDQSVSINESFGSEATADVANLQQALLDGQTLEGLEATAAGEAGGIGGGASLGGVSFLEGGHSSNVSSSVGNLDEASSAGANVFATPLDISANAQQPQSGGQDTSSVIQLDAKKIEIPLSAYTDEATSLSKILSLTNSLPSGFTITNADKTVDGTTQTREYLQYDEAKFDVLDNGWYVSKDKSLVIGSDQSTELVITNAANANKAEYVGKTILVLEDGQVPTIFGGDYTDKIIVDNVKVEDIYGGAGADIVDAVNGAKVFSISGGTGSDDMIVKENSKLYTETKTETIGQDHPDFWNHVDWSDPYPTTAVKTTISGGYIDGGKGDDKITIENTTIGIDPRTNGNHYQSEKYGYISGNDGDDTIMVKNGATIYGNIEGNDGDDKVYIQGAGTSASGVNTHDGDDEIYVQDGADMGGLRQDFGGGSYAIYGGNISSGIGSDKIEITDGSKVREIRTHNYKDAEKTTSILVDNSEVNAMYQEGFYNGGYYEGNAGNKFNIKITGEDSKVSYISGGYADNEIVISDGARVRGVDGYGGQDKIVITGDGTSVSFVNSNSSGSSGRAAIDSLELTISDGAKIEATKSTDLEFSGIYEGKINGYDNGDIINISNKATVNATIMTKGGDDRVTISDSTVKGMGINLGLGNDIVEVKDGARVEASRSIYGDVGDDVITIAGKNTYVSHIEGRQGNDNILVKDGATVSRLDGNDDVDTIVVDGATVRDLGGFAGNDEIIIQGGAKVTKVAGGIGDDTIVVQGKDTVITGSEGIGGGSGSDTIIVKDGAVVESNVLGDNGSGRFAYSSNQPTDGSDTIIISGSDTMVKNIVGGSGGDDKIVIEDSANVKYVQGDGGSDTVVISGQNTTIHELHTGYYDGKSDTFVIDNHAGEIRQLTKTTGDILITNGEYNAFYLGSYDDSVEVHNDGNYNLIIDSVKGNQTIDLSKVGAIAQEFKTVDLNKADNTTLDISKIKPQDMLDINSDKILKIDGDSDNEVIGLTKNGWTKTSDDMDGYKTYEGSYTDSSNNTQTVVIHIDKDIQTDL